MTGILKPLRRAQLRRSPLAAVTAKCDHDHAIVGSDVQRF